MAVSEVAVDGVVFPPVARPPGSGRSHFLAGAGVRGMEIGGNFIKFTAIGVYVEDAAVTALAKRWAGKTADEVAADAAFFRDVVTGEFEKFTRVTMILPLTGEQYSDKVTENCVAYWKATGVYTDAEGVAVEKFKEAFKPETFPPGASILFTHSPTGGVLQGLVCAGDRRRGDREQAALRGRAGVHHRGARRLAGGEAEHRDAGVGAPQGDQHHPRRRATGGARRGLLVVSGTARRVSQ